MDKTAKATINRDRFIAMPGINCFPERLKIAMEGMTNVALASKCGLSESAVRGYLKGRSYPGIDKIQAIAQACNAPMVWLITGEIGAEKDEKIAQMSDSLASVLAVMTQEQRHQLAMAIVQHGISGIFNALQGIEGIAAFAMLPENERARVMRLYSEVKKGASSGDRDNELDNPTHKQTG
jgi:transcriptional regulator with XRE-family HTH domain